MWTSHMLLLISCLLLEPGKITQTCENAGCAEPNPDEPPQPEGTNEPDVNVDTGPPGTDADGDGHYAESTDCDDSSPFVYSGAAENDSLTACLEDKDGDGYGAETPVSPLALGFSCCFAVVILLLLLLLRRQKAKNQQSQPPDSSNP